MQTATLSTVAASPDTAAYLATYDLAFQRANYSDFDVHVVRNADGSYWYADEGDYLRPRCPASPMILRSR